MLARISWATSITTIILTLAACQSGSSNSTQDNGRQTLSSVQSAQEGGHIVAIAINASLLTTARDASGSCALDSIADKTTTASSPTLVKGVISMKGWALTSDRQPVKKFMLVLRGTRGQAYGFTAQAHDPRPDVAEVLRAPSAGQSGFLVNIDLNGIKVDTYQVMALSGVIEGQYELCDMQRQVKISE